VGTIVVGVDGSEGSVVALRWALAEARLRGSSVHVVHAYQSPQVPLTEAGLGAAGGMGVPAVFTEDSEQLRRAVETEARNLIEEALRGADEDAIEGLQIDRDPIEGPAAQTLIETARGAELLVVGSRGRGGFVGLVLGSVSQQCAQHPPCPVVILPPPGEGNPARPTERAAPK
jgi:nucleotide-binding universal stress UspA family protein